MNSATLPTLREWNLELSVQADEPDFPFPPPALPGFVGTTSLSVTPNGPACPSRASGWQSRAATAGASRVPCFSSVRVPSPLPRWDRWVRPSFTSPATAAFPVIQAGRLPHRSFRGLLSVHSGYGPQTRQVA